MMIRFIEFAVAVLLAAWIVTRVLVPLFTPKKRDAALDEERATRRRGDAERRLHAAVVDGEARRIEKETARVRNDEEAAAAPEAAPGAVAEAASKTTEEEEEGKQEDGTQQQ